MMYHLPYRLTTLKGEGSRFRNRFDPLDIDPLMLVEMDPMDEDVVLLGQEVVDGPKESNFTLVEAEDAFPLYVLPQPEQSPAMLPQNEVFSIMVVMEEADKAKVGVMLNGLRGPLGCDL
ncbi:hypothetical protein AMTR_s00116p00113460 [Amborella trichopoda]|uniref:Uncharacterized protein n=1 Tax=Amborella trichopoda TaxID=13333 RepID=W1NNY3_AMBTC|nr:hypothetical protein AMTR_s00116p00113460 [Amborella trichopoda]